MTKKSGLAVQYHMLRLAEVSGTSIECINIVKYKRFRKKLGPRVHCLYQPSIAWKHLFCVNNGKTGL